MGMKSKKPFTQFADWLIKTKAKRPPDFVIGGHEDPYLRRWFILPRNYLFNIYLHEFLRSDDDRALHDHPWPSVSVILRGGYWEVVQFKNTNIQIATRHGAGRMIVRPSGKLAHRIVIDGGTTCWTLFITGPRYRNWGFYCPQGWVRWEDFTDPSDEGGIGKGCDQ